MKKVKTYWASSELPFGAFDDSVFFRCKSSGSTLTIQIDEFNALMREIFELYKNKQVNYFYLLKIWNEVLDVFDNIEKWYDLLEPEDFFSAVKMIKGMPEPKYSKIIEHDIKLIEKFLNDHNIVELEISHN
ncbi:MAG: hypothetical protein MK105_19075 [Crocinitomicaceae bacterium]|nr:hypothetical protein [Crocinitomicaceae bacterium]